MILLMMRLTITLLNRASGSTGRLMTLARLGILPPHRLPARCDCTGPADTVRVLHQKNHRATRRRANPDPFPSPLPTRGADAASTSAKLFALPHPQLIPLNSPFSCGEQGKVRVGG